MKEKETGPNQPGGLRNTQNHGFAVGVQSISPHDSRPKIQHQNRQHDPIPCHGEMDEFGMHHVVVKQIRRPGDTDCR